MVGTVHSSAMPVSGSARVLVGARVGMYSVGLLNALVEVLVDMNVVMISKGGKVRRLHLH